MPIKYPQPLRALFKRALTREFAQLHEDEIQKIEEIYCRIFRQQKEKINNIGI